MKFENKVELKRADDIDVMRDITTAHFRVNVMKVKRSRKMVEGRMVMSLVLFEYGYTLSEVARYFKKHHTTIMHYRSTAYNILEVDDEFRKSYLTCREKFFTDRRSCAEPFSVDQLRLNLFDLKNKVYTLSKDVEKATSDRDYFKSVVDKYKRIRTIINFIDDNTPEGVEEYVLDVIKDTFKKLKT